MREIVFSCLTQECMQISDVGMGLIGQRHVFVAAVSFGAKVTAAVPFP